MMFRPRCFASLCASFLLATAVSAAAQQPAPSATAAPKRAATVNPESLIDALAAYPFGAVYSEDINQPNSITFAGKPIDDNYGVIPAAPVLQIFNLGQKVAIPLLIAHLTDQRPSQATYHDQPVPVAYLALDMLLSLTDVNDERAVVPGCEQNGLGDCMQPEFYFSPDTTDPNKMTDVQKAWAEENRKQPIALIYPNRWRSAEPAAPPAAAKVPPQSR
jgi:hypothetical protein